jgi:hypothetical protein
MACKFGAVNGTPCNETTNVKVISIDGNKLELCSNHLTLCFQNMLNTTLNHADKMDFYAEIVNGEITV